MASLSIQGPLPGHLPTPCHRLRARDELRLRLIARWGSLRSARPRGQAQLLFGNILQEMWLQTVDLSDWTASNHATNLFVALLNSTLLIWLYASLRPMYGVGTKTALITAALGAVWMWCMIINLINLGLIPLRVGLVEMAFETVEFPIAMLVGAGVYEGLREEAG